MLDLNLIREHPDLVRVSMQDRQMDPAVVDSILDLDERRRQLLTQVEKLKAERNATSKEIGRLAEGHEREAKIAAMSGQYQLGRAAVGAGVGSSGVVVASAGCLRVGAMARARDSPARARQSLSGRCAAAVRRALAIAVAVAKRAAGSLARAHRITSSYAAGISGRRLRGAGGG